MLPSGSGCSANVSSVMRPATRSVVMGAGGWKSGACSVTTAPLPGASPASAMRPARWRWVLTTAPATGVSWVLTAWLALGAGDSVKRSSAAGERVKTTKAWPGTRQTRSAARGWVASTTGSSAQERSIRPRSSAASTGVSSGGACGPRKLGQAKPPGPSGSQPAAGRMSKQVLAASVAAAAPGAAPPGARRPSSWAWNCRKAASPSASRRGPAAVRQLLTAASPTSLRRTAQTSSRRRSVLSSTTRASGTSQSLRSPRSRSASGVPQLRQTGCCWAWRSGSVKAFTSDRLP